MITIAEETTRIWSLADAVETLNNHSRPSEEENLWGHRAWLSTCVASAFIEFETIVFRPVLKGPTRHSARFSAMLIQQTYAYIAAG